MPHAHAQMRINETDKEDEEAQEGNEEADDEDETDSLDIPISDDDGKYRHSQTKTLRQDNHTDHCPQPQVKMKPAVTQESRCRKTLGGKTPSTTQFHHHIMLLAHE